MAFCFIGSPRRSGKSASDAQHSVIASTSQAGRCAPSISSNLSPTPGRSCSPYFRLGTLTGRICDPCACPPLPPICVQNRPWAPRQAALPAFRSDDSIAPVRTAADAGRPAESCFPSHVYRFHLGAREFGRLSQVQLILCAEAHRLPLLLSQALLLDSSDARTCESTKQRQLSPPIVPRYSPRFEVPVYFSTRTHLLIEANEKTTRAGRSPVA